MGYDVRHEYEIEIPPDKVTKANELLVEYYKKYDDELLPGLYVYDDHTELVVFDTWPMDGGECIPDDARDTAFISLEYPDNIAYWIHSDNAYDVLSPAIDYLHINGVDVSGWLFTDWEQSQVVYNFWINGEHIRCLNEAEIARLALSVLEKEAKE